MTSNGGTPPAPEYPFQATEAELAAGLARFSEITIASLSSFYLELPRGGNFTEYERFNEAYARLHSATDGFTALDKSRVRQAVLEDPLVLVVLRCILGLSPPELADLTSAGGTRIDQGFARSTDQRARGGVKFAPQGRGESLARVTAMIDAACEAISKGPSAARPDVLHRLDKVDTNKGLGSLREVAGKGVPYSVLLYERMLGRPFASHRDSVSELVGDNIEAAIVAQLEAAKVPFHKTRRAERIPGFDQAPDFLVPNKATPKCVIEAKLTQDDGTARDKVTRVQHLGALSDAGKKFQVVACIDGRGFSIRREDMKKLLAATHGKVFTMQTIPFLVDYTAIKEFRGT